ncbi:hypothetical protein [Bacillus sp. AFS040349]|nr:hypothetical protein [Bacillus sp. AFS040349]
MKKILYSKMYDIKINGIALVAFITLCIYGIVSLIREVIALF